jgi:hypothetical protein
VILWAFCPLQGGGKPKSPSVPVIATVAIGFIEGSGGFVYIHGGSSAVKEMVEPVGNSDRFNL